MVVASNVLRAIKDTIDANTFSWYRAALWTGLDAELTSYCAKKTNLEASQLIAQRLASRESVGNEKDAIYRGPYAVFFAKGFAGERLPLIGDMSDDVMSATQNPTRHLVVLRWNYTRKSNGWTDWDIDEIAHLVKGVDKRTGRWLFDSAVRVWCPSGHHVILAVLRPILGRCCADLGAILWLSCSVLGIKSIRVALCT